MSTQFIYSKAHFEKKFISFLEPVGNTFKWNYLKNLLDNIKGASKASKERAINIVKRYIKGEEWWSADEAKELTMLWRCARLTIADVYSPQTIAEYSYERLAEAEADLEAGIINEQKYVDRCNNIKSAKEEDEALLDACACKTISSMSLDEDAGVVCLTVICLPHDFNWMASVL